MDENRFDLIEKMRALDETQWLKWQKIIGGVLGLATAACLFLIKDSGGFLPINFLAAFVIAITGPRYIERRTERQFNKGRNMLMIVFAAFVVLYLAYTLFSGGFSNGLMAPKA